MFEYMKLLNYQTKYIWSLLNIGTDLEVLGEHPQGLPGALAGVSPVPDLLDQPLELRGAVVFVVLYFYVLNQWRISSIVFAAFLNWAVIYSLDLIGRSSKSFLFLAVFRFLSLNYEISTLKELNLLYRADF